MLEVVGATVCPGEQPASASAPMTTGHSLHARPAVTNARMPGQRDRSRTRFGFPTRPPFPRCRMEGGLADLQRALGNPWNVASRSSRRHKYSDRPFAPTRTPHIHSRSSRSTRHPTARRRFSSDIRSWVRRSGLRTNALSLRRRVRPGEGQVVFRFRFQPRRQRLSSWPDTACRTASGNGTVALTAAAPAPIASSCTVTTVPTTLVTSSS